MATSRQSGRKLTNNSRVSTNPGISLNAMQAVEMVQNFLASRESLMYSSQLSRKRDINVECDFPRYISLENYEEMYARNDVSARVVALMPDECFSVTCDIFETKREKRTSFERKFAKLRQETCLDHYWHRLDVMSGITQYGVMLIGINDGKSLDQAVEGVVDDSLVFEDLPDQPVQHRINYLRIFPESLAKVSKINQDSSSARFGQPEEYEITFADTTATTFQEGATVGKKLKVHWSRVLHQADNCESNPVLGVPRQQRVYNALLSLRKVAAADGEGFWKAAFPGFSVESQPNPEGASISDEDIEEVKRQMYFYMNSMERYLAMAGVTVKSLAPQIADPTAHMMLQLNLIAIAIPCPLRVFLGTEEGRLASNQDVKNWNKTIRRRHNNYLTPMMILKTIYRLIAMRVLPKPKRLFAQWPDIDAPTGDDRAKIALKQTQALAAYAVSGVNIIMPLLEYLTIVWEIDLETATTIVAAALKGNGELDKRLLEARGGLEQSSTKTAPGGSDGQEGTRSTSEEP